MYLTSFGGFSRVGRCIRFLGGILNETQFSIQAGWLQGEGSGLGVFLSAHMNLSHGRVREDWAHHHRNSARRMQQDAHQPAGTGDALPVSPPGLHVDVRGQSMQRLTCLSFLHFFRVGS